MLLAILVASFVVTGAGRLPQLGWRTVTVVAVVLTLLAYGLLMYTMSLPVAWRLARGASPAVQP